MEHSQQSDSHPSNQPTLSLYSLSLSLSPSFSLSIQLEIPLDYPHNFPRFLLRRKAEGRGGVTRGGVLKLVERVVNFKAVSIWLDDNSR